MGSIVWVHVFILMCNRFPSYRRHFYGEYLRDRNGALMGDLVIADAEIVFLVR